MYDSKVLFVDRWFPSTKLCMECGTLHEMPLSKRKFKCSCNGIEFDRDEHAAQNIIRQALSKLTPLEIEALARNLSETTVDELGINYAKS